MPRLIYIAICLFGIVVSAGCRHEGFEPTENPSVTNLGYGHVLVCNNGKCQLVITLSEPSREMTEVQLESFCRMPAYREMCEALYNERAARLAEEQAHKVPSEDEDQGILYQQN